MRAPGQAPSRGLLCAAQSLAAHVARVLACLWIICSAAPAWAAEPLRIAVSRGPLSLPLYVAQAQGYFAAEAVDVDLVDCLGGHRCLPGVFEGWADLATASELPVVFGAFDGAEIAIIATFVTADDHRLIVRSASGVAKVADLAGKRIGAVAGTSSQYFLDLTLLAAGVDPRTVNIVGLQPEQTAEALRTGHVDAIAVWEPYGHLALQALRGEAKRIPTVTGYLKSFNLIAPRRLLKSHRVELTRLLRAVDRAQRFIAEQPAQAKALLQQRLQMDPALVEGVWPGMSYRLTLSQSLIATMESEARWAQREGHVRSTKRPNFLDLVDTTALKAAKPAAVGIER